MVLARLRAVALYRLQPCIGRRYAEEPFVDVFGRDEEESTPPKMPAPKAMLGKSGEQAMWMFEAAYDVEGDVGVRRIEKELALLAWTMQDDGEWRVQTTSAFFDRDWKHELVRSRLAGAGWQCSALLVELVMSLVDNGEIRRLRQISDDFGELMRAYRKEVDVDVTTASSVTPAQLALIVRSVQSEFLAPDDNVIVTHSVDTSLLDGYRVRLRGGQQEVDLSHAPERTRLADAERRMRILLEEQFKATVPRAPSPLIDVDAPDVHLRIFDEMRADADKRGLKTLVGIDTAALFQRTRARLVAARDERALVKQAAAATLERLTAAGVVDVL